LFGNFELINKNKFEKLANDCILDCAKSNKKAKKRKVKRIDV